MHRPPASDAPGPLRLLLVEDEEFDAAAVEDSLSRTAPGEFVIERAACLADAILAFPRADVAILDMGLPDSMGIQTVERARAAAPDLPMVILTGSTDASLPPRVLRAGAQDYVRKGGPEWDHLDRALRYALERSRAEREARALQKHLILNENHASLGALVAGIAHEINNPLCFAQMGIEMARDELNALGQAGSDPGLREKLAAIARQHEAALKGIARVASIVQSLRRVGHATPLARSPTDVAATVRQAALLAGPRLSGVRIDEDLDDLPLVSADATSLTQVFLNLILNAASAMDGLPTRVLTLRGKVAGDRVLLVVQDTGSGIPPTLSGLIYAPFLSTKDGAKGLGLSVARAIVVDHGGSIDFERPPEGGTAFVVALPIEAAPREAPGPSIASIPTPTVPSPRREAPRA